jgi:hypothetical protein
MKDRKCFSEVIIRNLQIFCPYLRTIINKTKKKRCRKPTDMAVTYDYLSLFLPGVNYFHLE